MSFEHSVVQPTALSITKRHQDLSVQSVPSHVLAQPTSKPYEKDLLTLLADFHALLRLYTLKVRFSL